MQGHRPEGDRGAAGADRSDPIADSGISGDHGLPHVELWSIGEPKGFHSKRADLYLSDCFFICGPMQGGPSQLEAAVIEEAGQRVIQISAGAHFQIKALRAALAVVEEQPRA